MSTSISCKLAFESKKGGHKPFPQHVVSHARKIVHPFRGLVVAPMRLEISLYCSPLSVLSLPWHLKLETVSHWVAPSCIATATSIEADRDEFSR